VEITVTIDDKSGLLELFSCATSIAA